MIFFNTAKNVTIVQMLWHCRKKGGQELFPGRNTIDKDGDYMGKIIVPSAMME
jgi:hypothetical protein